MKILNTFLRALVWLGCVLTVSYGGAQTVPTWTSLGPAGGSVTTLLADPVSPRTNIYVGSVANGVFLSTDAGVNWHSANAGIAGNAAGQRHIYAMTSVGGNVYVATDTGVYSTAGGGSPVWHLVPSPLPSSSTSVIDLMVSTSSTLYLAVNGESSVYSTTGTNASPAWVAAAALPAQSTVAALGVIGGQIAVGSAGVVYVPDGNGGWVNSETIDPTLATSALAGDTVSAMVSSSSKWAFACTLAGTVFKKDLSAGLSGPWVPLAWDVTGTVAAPVSDSCHGLSIARVGSNNELVLIVSTPTGAFVSDVFDDVSVVPGSLVPGPTFPTMTASVNGALQLDPSALSNVLWATEYGVYSSLISGVDSLLASKGPASALSGPSKITTPSQRLDNVNVHDVAALGSTLYAVAASYFNTYADVMSSTDGGATWIRTGLRTQFLQVQAVRSIVSDKVHNVVYAGTDQGIFAYSPATTLWSAIGGTYDVSALAVGAQALYSGRKISASAVPNSALVIQPLIGGASFTPVERSPGDHFNVRSLVVSGGSVYVGGGSAQDASDTDSGPYDNAVFVAPDFNPASAPSTINWVMIANAPFANALILTSMEVAGSEVFVGGAGFLNRSRIDGGSWGGVTGLPILSSGDTVSVSALASDGQTLYVGTAGQGLFALALATNTASLIPVSGTGDAGLPSLVVNGVKSIDGSIYVATAAGLSKGTTVTNAGTGGVSGSTGGGCSVAIVGEPDPLLWLLVVIAALQIAWTRLRRNQITRLSGVRLQGEGEANL